MNGATSGGAASRKRVERFDDGRAARKKAKLGLWTTGPSGKCVLVDRAEEVERLY
jgi:hypothetical protein